MSAILTALFNPILPIFAISALGFALGRFGLFNADAARTLNRFVLLVALPALLFSFLISAPFHAFNWPLITVYFASSLSLYLLGFLLMRYVFRLPFKEALLLGMAACFTNHVFFVLYIASILYGDAASLPVLSVIAFDAFLIFGGTFLFLDLKANQGTSPLAPLLVLLKNPMILSLVAGLTVGFAQIPVHEGLVTYAKFTGGAAAPVSMFALGVVLAGVNFIRLDGPALVITGLKLAVHPFLVFLILSTLSGGYQPDDLWHKVLFFTAAGPCGAMPFVLALQHQVDTSRIVKTIIYSTLLSLITLAVLA